MGVGLELRREIAEMQLYECAVCGGHMDRYHAHHIVAKWQGGGNGDKDDLNLVAVHPKCHVQLDNNNVLGELWGGVRLEDCSTCQVDDWDKHELALDQVELNRRNTDLVERIVKGL
jgi:hypothetical protein